MPSETAGTQTAGTQAPAAGLSPAAEQVPAQRSRPAEPAAGQGLQLDAVLLGGRGNQFRAIAAVHRTLTLHLTGPMTLLELTHRVLTGFGLYDLDHHAEIRARPDRRPHPADDTDWPFSPVDQVYRLFDNSYVDTPNDVDARALAVSALFGVGDVAYLRFDFGDEWWWRLQVAAGGTGGVEERLPWLVFAQYDGDLGDDVLAAPRP